MPSFLAFFNIIFPYGVPGQVWFLIVFLASLSIYRIPTVNSEFFARVLFFAFCVFLQTSANVWIFESGRLRAQ